MPEFTGFKSTTLVGKNDLPSGSSVVKTPQNNLVIHEYIAQPIVKSTSTLDSVIRGEIELIGQLTKIEVYQSQSSKSSTIKDKVVPAAEEIAIP